MKIIFTLLLLLSFSLVGAQPIYESDSLLDAGYKKMYEGEFEEAGKIFFEALSKAQKNNNEVLEAEAYRLLGEVNRASGNRPFAIRYLDKAEQKFNQAGNEYGLASTKNRKAAVYFEDSKYPECLKYIEGSIKIARKNDFKDILYNSLTILGAYQYYIDSNFTVAKHTLLEALTIAKEIQATMDYPYIYNNLSRVYERLKNIDSALIMAHQSYDIGIRYNIRSYVSFSSGHLSLLYAQKGDYKNAWNYERIYNQYRDSMVTETKSKAIADILEAYQAEKNENLIMKQRWQFKFLFVFTSIIFILLGLLLFVNIKLRHSSEKLNNSNAILEENRQELQSLNTLKDRLLTVLSHDLRSPVATLQSALDLINNKDLTQEETNAIMSEMGMRIERTGQLLDNLLVWIKNQVKSIEPYREEVDLYRLIKENSDLMEPEIRLKKLEVQCFVEPGTTLFADKEMMKLIIRNLLSNAIKFSRTGQSITWKAQENGDDIVFSISDEGIGIPKEKIEDIFSTKKVFTAGTNDEIGMGLGLSVVRDFVFQNGGKIDVNSQKDKGTVFTLTFPARYRKHYT